MSYPQVKLGGVPIVIHARPDSQTADSLGGEGVVRLSEGAGVKLTHWRKATGSISSSDSWMPPGLDGLDYSGPLELWLTIPECITQPGTTAEFACLPRDDVAPWVLALIGNEWVRTTSTYEASIVVATPVVGASLYAFYCMPKYMVLATKPGKSMGGGVYGWTINWEEV